MNPVQSVFPFEIVLAPHETGFVWYLATKKKRASARVCQMFLFLCVPFPSVSLPAANNQIDHSWTFSVKSLHKTEAKSDVIYSGKDWKQGNWFSNALVTLRMIATPWNCNENPAQRTSAFTLLENHSVFFVCFFLHFAHHTAFIFEKRHEVIFLKAISSHYRKVNATYCK